MNCELTLRPRVEEAFANRKLITDPDHIYAIEGHHRARPREVRVASPPATPDGEWTTHAWVKQAIVLYFLIRKVEKGALGPLEYIDKIPLKRDLDMAGIRVVPPAAIRFGAFIEEGAIVMPSFVNIGARVGGGTMVDTWATVGSCAQIGRDCHLSGGVGIGGVLEPPNAQPVIVEDAAPSWDRAPSSWKERASVARRSSALVSCSRPRRRSST